MLQRYVSVLLVMGAVMSMRRAGAEFLGTFVLVFGGVGAAVIAGEQIGFLGIAFAFGLSLLAMAYAIGPALLFGDWAIEQLLSLIHIS
jgi:hypothetical protein